MSVVRLPGGDVVLTPGQAARLVAALAACQKLARGHGARLPVDVRRLATDLAAAAGTTEPTAGHDDDGVVHDLIDTATAARILGCTPRNVRSLVARGRLTGHYRAGRVLCHRDEVEARASRQLERRRHDHVA